MPVLTKFLYVDALDDTDLEWVEQGIDPYLNSIVTANRIESDEHDKNEKWFDFENENVIVDKIKAVFLEVYCKQAVATPPEANLYIPTIKLGVDEHVLTPKVPPAAYGWRVHAGLEGTPYNFDTWAKVNALQLKLNRIASSTVQTFQLDVDGFSDDRGGSPSGWNRTPNGGSPYLDAVDANEINTKTDGDTIGDFTFEDLTISKGYISTIKIKMYAKQEGTGETVDFYVYDGAIWHGPYVVTPSLGMYGTTASAELNGILDTVAKINAAKVYLVYGKSGAANFVHVDHVYLDVGIKELVMLEVACARIRIDYYEDSVCVDRNPTATEVDAAGWNFPTNAYTSDNSRTDATGIGPRQNYKTYGFGNEPIGEVYTVIVKVEGYMEGADAVGVKVSWDGGASWSTTYVVTLPVVGVDETIEVDVTSVTAWTPSKLSDANFKVKLLKGQVGGCLALDSEVDLWEPNLATRIQLKNKLPTIKASDLYELFKRVQLIQLPKMIGVENKIIRDTQILEVIKHVGACEMYHVTVEGYGVRKDVKGSGTHVMQTVFRGEIPLRMLSIGDYLCGRFWNDKKENYELRPMKIVSIEKSIEKVRYEIKTNSKRFFTQYTLQGQIKW